ncbi:hypothetical protein NW761_006333 [Fusarium oxysporum]|nr:hypothetical protein NW761_006333 [Fusarium oxysporum]
MNDQLSKASLSRMKELVVLSEKEQPYKLVCQALCIRYLWVDALCIIQGDAEDWSKESFQMSKIYEKSYLTLCIAQGDSCSSGFLKKDYTPSNLKINFQSKLNSAISGSHSSNASPSFRDSSKMHTRRRQVWQSRRQTWRYGPSKCSVAHLSRGSALEAADGSSIGHFRFMEGIDSLERGLSTWYSMIAGYSARNLTVQQDRFPAISALARSFAERFPDQRYLAGLWESNIHMGLLWTCPAWMEFDKFRDLVSKKYTAPSWSWAHRPLQVSWILSGDEHPTSELVIRETEVISEKHNPYGRVSKGSLFLTAKIFKPPTPKNGRVRLKHSYKYWKYKYMNVPTFNYMLHSKRKRFVAKILFDWDSYCAINDNGYPRGPMGDISLLLTANILPGDAPMMKSRDLPDDQEMLLGIVVRPSPEEEGAYEKLGLWYTEDREKGGRKFWKMFRCRILFLV